MGTDPAAICTIIAKNYVSFARTLCRSFLENHPRGKCFVLLIDEYDGYLDPSREPFIIVSIDDLDIPNPREFRFKYNITELSTATKPYFLKYLFDHCSLEKLLYLDPDILITGRLDRLYEELGANDILLTPHIDKDYPEDGLLPNDAHIMKSGIFNLGFIGIRRCDNTDHFLTWWQGKVYDKCVIDHAAGYFVDQKFIDLAISLYERISIVRDTGYNVAYWNLHSRDITLLNGEWMCNSGKLFFYHFSNYKPEHKYVLSGFQTRYELEQFPYLKKLYENYHGLLQENGYSETIHWPYSYACFSDKKPVNDVFRKIYGKHLSRFHIQDPFDKKNYPLALRILIPVTSIYDAMKRHLIDMAKKPGWFRKIAAEVYGPIPLKK